MSELKELNIDNTMLSTYRSCPRKYFHRHREFLTKEYAAAPLQFGAAVHKAIELFYLGAKPESAKRVAVLEYENVFDKTEEDEWRTPTKLANVLDALFERKLLPVVTIKGKLWAEQVAKVPLMVIEDTQINYIGKIDAIVDWLGDWYVMDFKTTSSLVGTKETGKSVGNIFWNSMYPHAATLGYFWLVRQLLKDEELAKIKGIMIEAIGSNKYGIAIERRTFSYSDDQIEEWLEGAKRTIKKLFDDIKLGANIIPQNFDSCNNFGSVCAFHDMCRLPKELRQPVKAEYKVEEWNPLKEKHE